MIEFRLIIELIVWYSICYNKFVFFRITLIYKIWVPNIEFFFLRSEKKWKCVFFCWFGVGKAISVADRGFLQGFPKKKPAAHAPLASCQNSVKREGDCLILLVFFAYHVGCTEAEQYGDAAAEGSVLVAVQVVI